MEIVINEEKLTTQVVVSEVIEINRLNQKMLELVLQCEMPIDFYGGQSALILNDEDIGKKFSIASPSSAKTSGKMEVHVTDIKGSPFSEWLKNKLEIGNKLYVCGVSGELFYVPGRPEQALLLVGWQDGLTAMIGIIQDIFESKHAGPVYLFHGVDVKEDLYLEMEIREITDYFPNFHYIPCVEKGDIPQGGYCGTVDKIVSQLLPDLSDWRAFLCGTRKQIHSVQRYAYLAGARLKDIYLEVTSI